MPEFAPGIPSRHRFEDLSKLPVGQLLDFIVQKHRARRAGLHYDVRLGNPDLGLISFAARKGLPGPGEKHLAIEQPTHSHAYGQFEGTIPHGYGAGEVKRHLAGQIVVTKVTPNELHFTTAHERYPQRFALIRPKRGFGSKNWLLLNTTPTTPIPYQKTHYKVIPQEQAEEVLKKLQPGSSVQAKIDGSAALARLGHHSDVFSYRTSKSTGRPILHTERLFGGKRPEIKIPKELQGTVLRGEIYGVRGKREKAIEPQELGGLLNATIANSLQKQKSRGINLKTMVFDILSRGGQTVPRSTPYHERMKMLEEAVKYLPEGKFHLPHEAKTPEEAVKLWRQVAARKHNLTDEGVVIHPLTGKPMKAKLRQEHDVLIRGFAPGKGKYERNAIGTLTYSDPAKGWKGPILGEVGTGFSDETRREFFKNFPSYLGRTARVYAQERFPSGALRAPAFISLHEDIPALKGHPK